MTSNAIRTHSNTLSTHSPHTPLSLPRAEEGVPTPSRTRKRARENVAGGTAAMVRETDPCCARELLGQMQSLAVWMVREKPSPEQARVALRIAREAMRLSAFTPDEEAAVAAKLQLPEAIALMEKSNVA